MSSKQGVVKNIVGVASSNLLTILSGVLIGFLVPKVMSVDGYGYYKIFTLYLTYTGLCSIGIIDGIVLKYGDKDYNQLDPRKFRTYFDYYTVIHIIWAVILCVIFAFSDNAEYKFIGLFLAIDTIFVNMTGYFQQISQITQRFKEYSLRKILLAILNIIAVLILFLIRYNFQFVDYKVYVLTIIVINALLTFWYIRTYKDIVFGKRESFLSTFSDIKVLVLAGLPLLFSNLTSSFILTLDRQFVSVLFDTTTYAVYAFAYSMLSLVTVAVSAISTVLYPVLKRSSQEKLKESFTGITQLILILLFAALVIYYPLTAFVEWFLPNYVESLEIFRIIFPGLAVSSCITIVFNNYYKVLNKSFLFFKKSIVALVISSMANAIAYFAFESTSSISWASIISLLFWYWHTMKDLKVSYDIKNEKTLLYIIVGMIGFYVCSLVSVWYLGLALYIFSMTIITFGVFRINIRSLLSIIK